MTARQLEDCVSLARIWGGGKTSPADDRLNGSPREKSHVDATIWVINRGPHSGQKVGEVVRLRPENDVDACGKLLRGRQLTQQRSLRRLFARNVIETIDHQNGLAPGIDVVLVQLLELI